MLTQVPPVSMFRAALRGAVTGSSERANGVNMPDNAHNEPGNQSRNEAALSARLRRLGDELGRDRPGRVPETEGPPPESIGSGMARGIRLSTELVAGVLVGALIGWGLDRWLGISPWGLIVFLLLGFAAGVLNVVRAAGEGSSDRT